MTRVSFLAVAKVTRKIDNLSLSQSRSLRILRIHVEHAAPVVNAAIPIVQTVDVSVELIVGSDRHQNEFSRLQFVARDRMHGEKRFADFVVELSLVTRCVRQIENILGNALVEILKTGNNMLDVIPNPIVIGNKSFPINRAAIIECRASKTGDNRRLTAQLIA